MKKLILLFYFLILLVSVGVSQTQEQLEDEDDVKIAFNNAMKGIYWAQENISPKREMWMKDIIVGNRNVCTVKVYKQVGGIKIISEGYSNSTKVEITTYRSLPEK